jgi:hypothetical protein
LGDQIEPGFLCRLLCRKPPDLLVRLSDPFMQLRALAAPCRPSRLEQLPLAGDCRARRSIVTPIDQLRRDHDGGGVVSLREEPRLPCRQFVELGSHHAKRGFGHRIVETQHDLACCDPVALFD